MASAAVNRAKPLIGQEEATIDDKGRILVAKKKRERLGRDFAMGINPSGVLIAMPLEEFNRVMDEIGQSEWINQGRQIYSAELLGTFEDELNFDKPGRVVIPQALREAAKLKSKVILIGAGSHMEIWAKEEYEIYLQDREAYGAERRELMGKNYRLMKEDR